MRDIANHILGVSADTMLVCDKGGKQPVKRKLFALILTLLLCVSLCACGNYRSNDGMMDKDTDRGQTEMTPDAEDGIVDDNTGTNGIISGDLTMPSPNVSHRP